MVSTAEKKVMTRKRNRARTFIGYLSESIYSPALRIPEQIDFSNDEIEIIRRLNWRDLDWNQIGDDGNTIVWLECSIPIDLDLSKSVIVDVQIIRDTFYQIHISLSEEIRGIGLGTKVYRSLIDWLGHIYSGKGRRHNPIINKVIERLKSDPGIMCKSNNLGDLCVSRNNPEADQLISSFSRF